MRISTTTFKNKESLIQFIKTNNIENSNRTFIQIFYSQISDIDLILRVRDYINDVLPDASIMGTSTAGIVENGKVKDNCISISFSLFEKSYSETISFKDTSSLDIIENLKQTIIKENTKLLVIFINTFTFNANILIKDINKYLPNIVICGGNSGDDFVFEKGLVFSNKSNNSDVVITAINSDSLTVDTNYLLNWQIIGKEMRVTKSNENIIYEINNESVLNIYEKYLGKEVASRLPESGIEFPLIFLENGAQTARAPIGLGENGALIMAGNIQENSLVNFGFANIEYIEENNLKSIKEKEHLSSEAMYIYSCSTRKKILGEFLDDELNLLNSISPSSGFMTYGEFYHDSKSSLNSLLNITTTYITLNESKPERLTQIFNNKNISKSKQSITLKALTHLVDKTTSELEDTLYYMQQFKDAMYKSLIFSSADEKGIITHANKNFEEISGYSKEELIGQSHSIVRSENTKKSIFKKMWDKLNKFEEWKGIIQNKRKDGSFYYVLSHIFPILNKDGSLREYISLRHDVTDTEKRRESLEGKIVELNDLTEDKEALLAQYSNIIDSFSSSYRFDLNFIITYGNNKFKEICKKNNCILNSHIKNIIEDDFYEKNFSQILKSISSKEVYKGIIKYKHENEIKYMDSTITPILDKYKNILEYMVIEYEITDILTAKQEIIDTQKDIIFTMGEIGETRSKETGNHVKRVAEYSKLLALLNGMNEEDAEILRMASPMHDIGKVGIPDSILNKPGKLTPEEWEIMKTHSELGFTMLKGSNKKIMKTASIVAKYHHEKFDGKGYPEGLTGENIPIEARITAVADVFDALGSDRVYKKAWKLNSIYDLLKEGKGNHFDPILIDLFFDNLDSFLEIRDKYQDL